MSQKVRSKNNMMNLDVFKKFTEKIFVSGMKNDTVCTLK
jgi:hypothetical protein